MIIKILLFLLTGILIGYNIGYMKGRKNAMKTATKSIPLILKEKSLIEGYCIICNHKNPLSK